MEMVILWWNGYSVPLSTDDQLSIAENKKQNTNQEMEYYD